MPGQTDYAKLTPAERWAEDQAYCAREYRHACPKCGAWMCGTGGTKDPANLYCPRCFGTGEKRDMTNYSYTDY